ncbi:MAG: hypothetical protein KGL00_02800 [Gammaproteobacteria bacterium]|nr:hypothetical protein [Gammaproteobacteria bacterium]MDE2140410.1 hypothetical protein [Gammaproteobacteria bacterium]MDE2273101.1 hypothetical protein [Gammaproteobacteria bacterium]
MRGLQAGVVALFAICVCGATLAAAPGATPLDVRNVITVSEFHQTGLDILSPDELQAFNRWLSATLNANAALEPASMSATSPDVRDLMSVTEYHRTGIDKLSPVQLKALNAWLHAYVRERAQTPSAGVVPPSLSSSSAPTGVSAAAGFGADTMAPKENPATPERIETRIAGRFTGWTGNTVFKLENGQVWKQAATGYFTNIELDHPQVIIKKLGFGYLLTLPGHGATVFVRRIK